MKEHKPFRDIPRWAPNKHLGEDSENDNLNAFDGTQAPPEIDEAPLEGPPSAESESIFLSIPEISNAASVVIAYDATSNYKERQGIVTETLNALLEDPRRLCAFLEATDILADSKKYANVKRFRADIEKKIESAQIPNTPLALERWVTLSVESKVYRDMAEKLLRHSFEADETEKAIVDRAYNLALGGFGSSNEKTQRRSAQIIGLQSPVLPPNIKATHTLFLSRLSDDAETFSKQAEIEQALTAIMNARFPDLEPKTRQAADRLSADKFFVRRSAAKRKESSKGAKRFENYADLMKLSTFMSPEDLAQIQTKINDVAAAGGSTEQMVHILLSSGIPASLIENVFTQGFKGLPLDVKGPLYQLFVDFQAESSEKKTGKRYVSMHFPNLHMTRVFDTKQIREITMMTLRTAKPEKGKAVTDEQYWKTLSYLLPEQFDSASEQNELLALLKEQNRVYIEELSKDTLHLLSPRGDTIKFEDPIIRGLDLGLINFQMDFRNKRDTIVRISVGPFVYSLLLDEYGALRDREYPDKPINLPPEGEFLRTVILSHLHAIRCTEFAQEEGQDMEGVRGPVRGGRRAHRRILPIKNGRPTKPTREQIAVIWKKYEIDINRLNAEREMQHQEAGKPANEFQFATYVSEVEPDESGPSVKLVAPQATAIMRQILKLPALETNKLKSKIQ